MADSKPFKLWFDDALVRATAARIADVEPRFRSELFVRRAADGLDTLEMMGRVGQIADALHEALPRPTRDAMRALVASMPAPAPDADGITTYGYAFWPYGEYIGRYGLDDVDASFEAMVELTQRFSAEFAVRPFLAIDPEGMLDRLEALVAHPSEHVRRFVSEGTRTRLPWGKKVPALEARAPRRLALLDALRNDPSRYVQRSVANHLQDALKDDRARTFPLLVAWKREGTPATTWIAKHAARGLLKAGDPETLALFGFEDRPVDVRRFEVSPRRVAMGGEVRITVTLRNPGDHEAPVRLDYVLESPGAKRTTRKTFRLGDLVLAPGATETRETHHVFVSRTIRQVRAGVHRIGVQVNGRMGGEIDVHVF